jgi:hypothetical protein
MRENAVTTVFSNNEYLILIVNNHIRNTSNVGESKFRTLSDKVSGKALIANQINL